MTEKANGSYQDQAASASMQSTLHFLTLTRQQRHSRFGAFPLFLFRWNLFLVHRFCSLLFLPWSLLFGSYGVIFCGFNSLLFLFFSSPRQRLLQAPPRLHLQSFLLLPASFSSCAFF